jgi:endonuclease G
MKHCVLVVLLLAAAHASAQSWLPDTTGCDCQLVKHIGYTLAYDECHEQARWVAYVLTRERVNGDVPRKGNDRFFPDTTVATGSASPWDYSGSGYSRGHLAPAADMKWSVQAMRESFLMSNISPQTSEFNDGIWQRAEKLVRQWAVRYDSIYVITGPVLDYDLPKLVGSKQLSPAPGHNGVSIPRMFYKVIYDPARKTGIGLLIEHRNSKRPLHSFAVTIDEVERTSGVDFFHGIENEDEMERTLCIPCWF